MLKKVEPTPAHEAYLAELKTTLLSSGANIPADEILAVTSQLIAVQDQRTMSIADIWEIVGNGNNTAISGLFDTRGSA